MKAPNLPSFFKKIQANKFNYKPLFYNENIKRSKRINFKRIHDSESSKGRTKRLIFIIIILSLLAYFFLK